MINHSPATQARAIVRRMDWRFLLPDPPGGTYQHLVLLGGSAELAARIVDIGYARRVSREAPKGRSADALVILHDASADLSETVRCLTQGGALYYEVERRRRLWPTTMPGRIRHALRRSGLSPTGVYWARPGFDGCQMYLPLDAAGPIRWFLDAKFVAATPIWRLLTPALRALTLFGSSPFAFLARCYAVTAVAGSESGGAPSVLGHPRLPASLQGSRLRPLVLTAGADDGNRVIILPFAPNASQPVAALKFSRLPDRNWDTEKEQIVLAEVHAALDGAMRGTIPDPLGILRWHDIAVGMESCVPGRLLTTSLGRWGASLRTKTADLHAATDWLISFHHQAQATLPPWQDLALLDRVETFLGAYEHTFGVTAGEQRLFTATRERARALAGIKLPRVWEHGAYADRNIYRAGRDVNVVDWEAGGIGLPLCDLLYFVTHWSQNARNRSREGDRSRSFGELFCQPARADRILAISRLAISEYMANLEIDASFFPVALVIMCIDHAMGQKSGIRSTNTYVKYIDVLAENADSLFSKVTERSLSAGNPTGRRWKRWVRPTPNGNRSIPGGAE